MSTIGSKPVGARGFDFKKLSGKNAFQITGIALGLLEILVINVSMVMQHKGHTGIQTKKVSDEEFHLIRTNGDSVVLQAMDGGIKMESKLSSTDIPGILGNIQYDSGVFIFSP